MNITPDQKSFGALILTAIFFLSSAAVAVCGKV
jgi:hypothetical protein